MLDERKAKRDQAKLDAVMVGKQRCSVCSTVKDAVDFSPGKGRCKACAREVDRRWRANNPDAWRAHQLVSAQRRRLARHGLSEIAYAALLIQQSGLCALCDVQLKPDCIDHDHQTGKVRGLLCSACNTSLHEGRDLAWYERAVQYLSH